MATLKNRAKNLPVGSSMKRKTQKGNSTPKAPKTRSTPQFYEVKIRMSAEDFARGKPYFDELKYLPKFFMDAYAEKVNRAEANNKSARLRTLMGNMELLEPVLTEMAKCGKLNFLKEIING
jgi:hypothetical protein